MEVCRLCLDLQSENTSIQLDGTYKDMVQVVAPELNLEISNTPAVCNKCSKNLEELYVFKTKCFENEENWRDQKSDIGAGTKTDSGNLIESKKAKDIVCRTCMDPIECGSFTVLKPSKSDAYLESMLTMCLPEVDLESTKDPLLCERCTDNLLKLHQFKSACLDIEDLLVNFCETYGTNSSDQINLHSVLESESKINADLGLRNIKCEQFDDESGDTSIKSVSDSEMTGNTSLKQEEVDIKSEEETSTGDNEKKRTALDSKFKYCTKCNYKSVRSTTLRLHMKTIHENWKGHACSECSFKTAKHYSLTSHKLLKHGIGDENKLKRCAQCNYRTLYSSNLQNHMKNVHEKWKGFTCSQCSLKTSSQITLKSHLLAQHGIGDQSKLKRCPHCDYIAPRTGNLNRHLQTVHEKSRRFDCQDCSYKTNFQKILAEHMFRVHSKADESNVLSCPHCSFKSTLLGNLQRHFKSVHRTVQHECPQCSFKATYKKTLNEHLLKQHDIGNKQIMWNKCAQCQFQTLRKHDLKGHVQRMHNVQFKNYDCPDCHFETIYKSAFTKHVRKQHGKYD